MQEIKEPKVYCRYDKLLPAADLKPHPDNTNRHPKAQIELLGFVIGGKKGKPGNGWRNTVVVSKRSGFITKGHARHETALANGWKVPVEYQDYANLQAEKQDMAADNIVAELAEQDSDMLKELLREANGLDVDVSLYEFAAKQAELLLGAVNEPEANHASLDRIKELDRKWKVKTGQLWRLGEHRLICGDSRDAEIVKRVTGGGIVPDLCVTDPPYGVGYDPNWRNDAVQAGQHGKKGASKGTKPKPQARAIGLVQNDHLASWLEAYKLFPGAVLYCWHASGHAVEVANDIVTAGFELRAQIIWNKNNIVISRGAYHFKHEPCWYAVRKGKSANWQGDRKQCTVWDIDMIQNDTGHSTQKPLECMARPIRNHTREGQAVYEPFNGSGTTLMACQTMKRICYAVEIDTGFCALTLQRFLDATGIKPELVRA